MHFTVNLVNGARAEGGEGGGVGQILGARSLPNRPSTQTAFASHVFHSPFINLFDSLKLITVKVITLKGTLYQNKHDAPSFTTTAQQMKLR